MADTHDTEMASPSLLQMLPMDGGDNPAFNLVVDGWTEEPTRLIHYQRKKCVSPCLAALLYKACLVHCRKCCLCLYRMLLIQDVLRNQLILLFWIRPRRGWFQKKRRQWAVKNFESWARNRSSSASEIAPPGILHSHDAELVCKWLCCFVLETRKLFGSRYPPATKRSLVSGLNRELQRLSAPFSVLDKGDYRFRALQCFIEIKGSIVLMYCTVSISYHNSNKTALRHTLMLEGFIH